VSLAWRPRQASPPLDAFIEIAREATVERSGSLAAKSSGNETA
jgi:hypothetical protein